MEYEYDIYDNELQTDSEGEYLYPNEDDDLNDIQMTFQQLLSSCILPTITQTVTSLSFILVWNLVFRVSTQVAYIPASLRHLLSLICGLLSLQSLFPVSFVLLIILSVFSFIPLLLPKHRGSTALLLSILFLLFCEMYWLDPRLWHQIRGPQMILVMKAVSLGYDLDIGTVRCAPNLLEYSGYMFCPGSCVLGPWTSYREYTNIYTNSNNRKPYWLVTMATSILLAFVFLVISTCFTHYLLPDASWKWFIAYRDALLFRCSHYFISYMSEATLLLSGYTRTCQEETVIVVKPIKVELPRSLMQVVVSWNLPMHAWLKVYVFNTTQRFGKIVAIFSTYVISSLLHGFNFQLAAVLCSLGLYSYVEFMLRKKLATAFNACILARACKDDCSHEFKWHYPGVLLVNCIFSLITIIHLAYLGVMFDHSDISDQGYSYSHTLQKWSHLGFFSHWLALGTYLFYFLI